jgi:hypothetical protein
VPFGDILDHFIFSKGVTTPLIESKRLYLSIQDKALTSLLSVPHTENVVPVHMSASKETNYWLDIDKRS